MPPDARIRFGDFPDEFAQYRSAAIVLLPIPFDKTSTWLKGSDKGPQAILEASQHLEYYDLETRSEVYRKGIHTAEPLDAESPEQMIQAAYERVGHFLRDKKFVVTLGGEHSVSIGPVKAFAERTSDLGILHLDAHSDRRDTYQGSRYNHACVIARISEFVPNIVSVGVRSMDASELPNIPKGSLFCAADVLGKPDWAGQVVERLSPRLYVSIDLDVFDPSVLPATGTPEPGGLGWYDVTRLLRVVARQRQVVGFDVVELRPGDHKASDFLAAKLICTFLSYVFCEAGP